MDNEKLQQQSTAVALDDNAENTGSFIVFLAFVRRFIWFIVLATVIGTGIGIGMAFKKDQKVYTQTKALVVVATIDNSSMSTNISLTEKWRDTIKNTIKSPVFMNKANEVYRNDFGGAGGGIYAGAISINTDRGLIFKVSYSDSDPQIAANKLDAYIKAASEEIQSKEVHYITADSVKFQSIDRVPDTSVSSEFMTFVLLGVVAGLALGVIISFLIYLFDSTVSSKSELERLTGATVVAYIDDVAQ